MATAQVCLKSVSKHLDGNSTGVELTDARKGGVFGWVQKRQKAAEHHGCLVLRTQVLGQLLKCPCCQPKHAHTLCASES